MLLKDKTALVTGIGSGIGRAAALLFAEHGARVSGLDIDEAAGQEVIEAIKTKGGEGLFVQTDVTNDLAVKNAIQTTINTLGHINVAFNVVGASGRRHGDGPVHLCTEEGWDWTMDVNLKSMYLCCKYLVEDMLEQGGGAIVNLASVLGLVGGDEDFSTHAYAASKGAVISLTRSMASYYAPHRIRANVICPSLIATAMSKRAQSNEHIIGRLPALQPLTGDFGTPEDVAEAALYLLSDNAKFVTGSVLTVDGGWTVR
ncbi:MAG: SDR family oxidoreductase [Rhodothermaceae bacterium]|nr:SDR family oxidoreductase [Rhodothermaceae bacterium]